MQCIHLDVVPFFFQDPKLELKNGSGSDNVKEANIKFAHEIKANTAVFGFRKKNICKHKVEVNFLHP